MKETKQNLPHNVKRYKGALKSQEWYQVINKNKVCNLIFSSLINYWKNIGDIFKRNKTIGFWNFWTCIAFYGGLALLMPAGETRFLYCLLNMIPLISLCVRRINDSFHSGYTFLGISVLFVLVMMLIINLPAASALTFLYWTVFSLFSLYVFLILIFPKNSFWLVNALGKHFYHKITKMIFKKN